MMRVRVTEWGKAIRMRMRGIGWGCLAVVLLAGAGGCSDKDSVPSGVLPLDKMQKVLWDMIQADQYAAISVAKDSLAHRDTKAETLKLYEQVFRLHDVSREKFRKSYQYYLDHPSLNQVLFDSLIAEGNRLRTEAYSRPVSNHPPPVVPPHLGAALPAPGGMPMPRIMPGGAPMPGGRPGAMLSPGARMPGRTLTPGGKLPHPATTVPPGGKVAGKDSTRKHS